MDVGPIARDIAAAYSEDVGGNAMRLWTQFTRLPPLAIRGRGLAERLGIVKGRSKAVSAASVPPTTVRPESNATTKPTDTGRA
jgi:hypothetical protein